MKVNAANERMKRKHFKWLKDGEGYSEATVRAVERAICVFEESTGHSDFKTYSERQALGFKNGLAQPRTNRKPMATSTKYHYLRHLQAFFRWLKTQPGYKTRINLDAISYLSLDKKSVRDALSPRPRRWPSLHHVLDLAGSIELHNDIDQRDRALIAILLLSGIRYTAVCTLSLACFDPDALLVRQDPRLGVRTKGGKVITTRLFPFSDVLVKYVVDWWDYLRTAKSFEPGHPLFPRTKVEQADGGLSFVANEVEPVFWSGGNSIRDILKRRSEKAGLEYYNPHAFRHAAVHIASQFCVTPEQFKAVSQNLGHEHVATTLKTYGMLDDHRIGDVLSEIDFVTEPGSSSESIPATDLEAFIKQYTKKG